MNHDPGLFCEAALTQLTPRILNNPQGLVYRYCFFKLLDFLNAVARQIANKQVLLDDVEEIRYWIEVLNVYQYAPNGINKKTAVSPTLHDWNYHHIIRMCSLWGINDWPQSRA